MNCVVIKGSPRGKRAGSSRAADAFIRGLRSEGTEVTEFVTRTLSVGHCRGCYRCWTRTPGQCVQRDDMDSVLPAIRSADLVVYAVPLYYFSVPGSMKNLIDRTLPLINPHLVESNGETSHPWRSGRAPRTVLISTCGFPEPTHFEPLVALVKRWTENQTLAGTILIPAAEPMAHEQMQQIFQSLYALIERAGRETVCDGAVAAETEELITADSEARIQSADAFRAMANSYWNSFQS